MKNIVLLLVSLLFAEAALQLACRISPTVDSIIFVFSDRDHEPVQSEPIKIFGGPLGRSGNPKYPEHDLRGYRNTETKNAADIVAIGDSHTYGTSVAREEAWPFALQESSDMTTYNMGLGGYGPAQYLLLLDQALELSPQIIVVGIYFGNDLFDNYRLALTNTEIAEFLSADELNTIRVLEEESELAMDLNQLFQATKPKNTVKVEQKVEPAVKPVAKPVVKSVEQLEARPVSTKPGKSRIETNTSVSTVRVFLSNNSALYGLVRGLKDMVYARVFPQPSVLADNFESATAALTEEKLKYFSVFDGDEGWRTILTSRYRKTALDRRDPRIDIGFKMTLRILTAMKQRLLSTQTKLLVVLLPTKESTFSEKVHNPGSHAGYSELIEYETGIREELTLFMTDNEIPYIDLLPYLQQSEEQPYFSNADGHPNALGHKVISEVILERITEGES